MKKVILIIWLVALAIIKLSTFSFAVPIPFGPVKADPRFHWNTLSTEHFSIHFYQGEENLAERTAEIAERVHRQLTQYITWAKTQKTQIVINDSVDIANAGATPLPYNTIFIYPTQPVLTLGHFEEWLETLLIHEYTHILDIDRVGGFSKILQRIIGRFWFPKLYTSPLFTEGFAVYNETYHTNGGRGRDPYIDMFLRMAFLSGTVPPLDRLSGFWDDWPCGSAPYIYGAALYSYIADKYGENAPQSLHRNIADGLWPWNVNTAARIATLRSLRRTWEDWKQDAAQKYHRQANAIRERGITESQPLTTSGFFKWNPIWDTTGDAIYYFQATTDAYPAVRRIDLQSKRDKSVMRLHTATEYPVFSLSPDGERLVVSQATFDRSFSLYNDLWVKNLKNGGTKRLTRRLRARDAAWNPNGDNILFVTGGLGKTGLMKILPESKTVHTVLSPNGVVFSEPAWAPDGTSFAASAWQKGAYQDIWVFDHDSTAGRPLIHDKAWDISPCWTNDGEYILFASDRTGVYNLFALELETGQLYQVTNILGGAFDPSVSPDGTRIAFAAYSAHGFDIHIMPLDKTKWQLADRFANDNTDFVFGFDADFGMASPTQSAIESHSKIPKESNAQKAEDKVSAPGNPSPPRIKSYSPFATLLPRFWLPYPAFDESGPALAGVTIGRDVLAKHSFVAQGQYGILSHRFGYLLNYVNDQFYPSLSFSIWNYPGMIQPLERSFSQSESSGNWYWSRGGSLLIQFPNVKAAYEQWFTLGLERQQLTLDEKNTSWAETNGETPFSGELADILVGWDFDNSQYYSKSISSTDGVRFSLVYRRYLSHLGSDYTFSEVTGDLRMYLPMLLRRHVLALRGSFIRNDMALPRFHPELSHFAVRGFDYLYADDIFSASAEYRLPVFEIQRGWELWPIFFQRLHACVFTDGALLSQPGMERHRLSVGAEIRMDAILGSLFQFRFRAGLALPIEPRGNVGVLIGIGEIF